MELGIEIMIMMDKDRRNWGEAWSLLGLQNQLGWDCNCKFLRGGDLWQCLVCRELYPCLLRSFGLCGVMDDANVGVRGRYAFCEDFEDVLLRCAFISTLLRYWMPAVSV